MSRKRSSAALGSALVLAATVVSAAPTASAAECWVLNTRSHQVATVLADAVAVSEPGDTLKVKGTCRSFDVEEGSDVTLQGPATVDMEGGMDYGPISNGGRLTLNHILVTGGYSTVYGGGIWNWGTLVLRGATAVSSNWAEDGAGGIDNYGTVIMEGRSAVTGNYTFGRGRGGGIWNWGTLVLKDHARVADNLGGWGGGVYNSGSMTMSGKSSVVGNNGAYTGGGVYNAGTLELSDKAEITGNAASEYGGGIFSEGDVTFAPNWRGTVCGNTPDDWPGCAS